MRSEAQVSAADLGESGERDRGSASERPASERKAPRSPLVARELAGWAFLGATLPAMLAGLLLASSGLGRATGPLVALAAGIGAALAGWLAVRRIARRLDAFARFLEQRLAATSSLVRREAEASARERRLAADLERKTQELEQRLRERALLFDVLRESVSSHDIDSVLQTLAERLGTTLRFREVAVLLVGPEGRLAVRAAWGFPEPAHVLGRVLAAGEGLVGRAAARAEPVFVQDVSQVPEYLAFWDEVERTGSFASVPILYQGKPIGMIALTRPPTEPLSEVETRYLQALAHQAALAIRNAQLIADLEARSTHDPLTGLANRRLFEERAERALAEARRYGHAVSLLAIDIDHFKQLNDRMGHPAGDAVLVAVARALERGVRSTDTVARIGGEEFAVVLPHTDGREATRVAEKLRQEVAKLELPGTSAQPLGHLSISVGVAELGADDDVGSALQRADAALYAAKRAGRDRVSSIPPPP